MEHRVILAVDVATSGIKVVVYDDDAHVMARYKKSYFVHAPKPGYAEQDPDEIMRAFFATLTDAISNLPLACKVSAISLGGVMHSILALDSQFRPATPLMIWADTRSQNEAKTVLQHHGAALYQTTGVPIHAMLPLTKIRWLYDNEPAIFRETRYFVSIKEYLIWHLTGRFVVDVSTAASSGLFHLSRGSWSDEALNIAGITGDMLSTPVACTESLPITNVAFTRLGSHEAVKDAAVVVGSTDGVLANLGSGAILDNEVGVTLGSSGAVRRVTNRVVLDEKGRTFCYPLDGSTYVVGGATNAGGIVWDWILSQFPPDEAAQSEVWRALEDVEIGAAGLLLLPYLTGERAPVWDDHAKGVLFGLSLGHRREHVWRAGAESMAYALASIYRLLQDFGPPPHGVIATGGFFQQPVWTKLLADVLGVPVLVSDDEESSARGSFLLAKSSLEDTPVSDVLNRYPAKLRVPVEPDSRLFPLYAAHRARFSKLYEAVRPLFQGADDLRSV